MQGYREWLAELRETHGGPSKRQLERIGGKHQTAATVAERHGHSIALERERAALDVIGLEIAGLKD